jgi:transposase
MADCGQDEFSMLELLIGLPNVRVLRVERAAGVLVIEIETAEPQRFCGVCGVAGVVKDRPTSRYADLPVFGQQAVLVWHKYRWECPGGDPSWTEDRPDIAGRSLSAMTRRAAIWATVQVGRHVRPVAQVAAELGVAWNTVMDTVTIVAAVMINDPDRIGKVTALGVDETVFQSAGRRRRRSFVSSVTDVEARTVLDVFQGRQRADLQAWFNGRERAWLDDVEVVVADLHEPFRAAFNECVPDAVNVADPLYVVMAANRCVDKTRRRVQNEQQGHRGRSGEPLFGARKLLMLGAEKLDPVASKRLDVMLACGDPDGEVNEAWQTKEWVRDIYTLWGKPELAAVWVDALIDECRASTVAEIRGLGRTLKQWREPILAWHSTGASNGPTEGLNSIIKKIKRVAAGFRNFAHYRTRILLAIGGCNWNLIGAPPR